MFIEKLHFSNENCMKFEKNKTKKNEKLNLKKKYLKNINKIFY